MFFITFLSLLALASAQSTHDPFYCFATDPIRPQTAMFTTISAYENIRGNSINAPLTNCTPSKFWMISRGGTRLPDENQIQEFIRFGEIIQPRIARNSDLGRTQLCRGDLENILNWRFNATITPDRSLELTETGWEELRSLAERYQSIFPAVLPATYNVNQFRFRHTYRERTADSLSAFASGLFGHSEVEFDDIPTLDRLLRPVDTCRLYDEWDNNAVESIAFREGIDFEQTLEQINRRLGFSGTNSLSGDEVLTLWDYCRFEQGWNLAEPSAWCSAFSIANNAVLEYADDLRLFTSSGYGGDERLFSNLNCHSMQDLLQFIQSDAPNDHLARVFITHSTIMRLFLVTLGAFRDEAPLTRHNFAQQSFRQWRTSLISSMASNLVVIQHTCLVGGNDLLIFYNERPLMVPGCEAPGLCKQDTFVRLFQRFVDANCDELYCSRN